MLDDALDYEADPETTGKNLGDDLAEGKPTLPLIHIIHHGDSEHAAYVRAEVRKHDEHDIEAIRKIIQDSNSIAYTKNLAKSYVEKSIACLDTLPDSPEKEALIALSKLAGDRTA